MTTTPRLALALDDGHAEPDDHHDGGLVIDLQHLAHQQQAGRRRALRLLGVGGALALGGAAAARAACTLIPEETEGPYPADGSNSASGGGSPGGPPGGGGGGGSGTLVNALMLTGIVRRDIRSSIAGASGVAAGVPLALRISLVNSGRSCARLSGYAVYVWHCDRDGNYSMYSSAVANQNYLRGVQVTNEDGVVVFNTIFPACYSGRWPHIHFEIYRDANTATSYTNKLRTSQIAMPADLCRSVYNTANGYSASVRNLSQVTLASDNVFSDGVSTQLPTTGGNLNSGLTASLQVGISV